MKTNHPLLLNLLIIGNGHYATGMTSIPQKIKTDKDRGVLLPSAFALRKEGLVNEIGIAARDGGKLKALKQRITEWKKEFGWETSLRYYPNSSVVNEKAYEVALREMPKPCVALIAVPDLLHKKVMLACLKSDVPFLIVKPAVTHLNDLYEIADACQKRNLLGVVDYHKIYDEANLLLKNEYEAGEYGKIYHCSSVMTQKKIMQEIYKRWLRVDSNFNVNHYLGSHYIHLIGYITKAIPLNVRATTQHEKIIQTEVRWRLPSKDLFTSYHVAGWNNPNKADAMTYQSLSLICEKGAVYSDQRDRGIRKVLECVQTPNPYFFNLHRDPTNNINLNSQYGYLSIKHFVNAAKEVLAGRKTVKDYDLLLPTIKESERVTAILEAADLSLKSNSKVIPITYKGSRYHLVK